MSILVALNDTALKKLVFLIPALFVFTHSDAQFFKRKNPPAEKKTEIKTADDKAAEQEEKKAEKEAKLAEKEANKAEREAEKAAKKAEKEQKEAEKAAAPKKWSEKQKENPPLKEVKWVLTDETGKSMGDAAYIQLQPKGDKLAGNTSCNNIAGSFKEGKDNVIKFTAITTKMACSDMKTENRMLSALNGANRYDMNGQNLLLYRDNLLLAIFEAKFD